jgi:hypothetical protein
MWSESEVHNRTLEVERTQRSLEQQQQRFQSEEAAWIERLKRLEQDHQAAAADARSRYSSESSAAMQEAESLRTRLLEAEIAWEKNRQRMVAERDDAAAGYERDAAALRLEITQLRTQLHDQLLAADRTLAQKQRCGLGSVVTFAM